MPHVFEPAATGRSKCRGCKQAIAKGELRFGEQLPNPFGEGEVTHWFHPACAAYKRPDAILEGLAVAAGDAGDRESLERIARAALAQHRLQRIDGAEFSPGGYIHLACRVPYFEAADIAEPLLHFSPALSAEERESLRAALAA